MTTGQARVLPLRPAAADGSEIALDDGSAILLQDGGAVIVDEQRRVRLRYRDGEVEICAPDGDLVMRAPQGRIVMDAAEGLELNAPELGVRCERLAVEAHDSRLQGRNVTVVADRVATSAASIVQKAERYELEAGRLVESARDAFRTVSNLAHTRLGRARTFVRESFALRSRRTVMRSESDTVIDGKRVLLG